MPSRKGLALLGVQVDIVDDRKPPTLLKSDVNPAFEALDEVGNTLAEVITGGNNSRGFRDSGCNASLLEPLDPRTLHESPDIILDDAGCSISRIT